MGICSKQEGFQVTKENFCGEAAFDKQDSTLSGIDLPKKSCPAYQEPSVFALHYQIGAA